MENSPYAHTSQALANLRGVFLLILVSFHASLAYLVSAPAPAGAFDAPPFAWLAFPIIDARRFFGFDLYCAWEDVQVMALMFFLSGLFVPASLARKGPWRFLADRALRLGAPYLLGVLVMTPLALYPAFRTLTPGAGVSDYLDVYRHLPFVPNGPQWFLGLLMAFSLAAAALAPATGALARLAAPARTRPAPLLIALALASACAYVPMALAFGPFEWFRSGPISFQTSRPLLYAVFFFAGIGVGAAGLGQGLLAPDGALASQWRRWAGGALLALFVWMAFTGAGLAWPDLAPAALGLLAALAYVGACVCGVMSQMAAAVRFLARPIPGLETLSRNTLGVFVFHYPAVVWLQYGLTGADLPGLVKGAVVFGVALFTSLTLAILMRRMGPLAALIGEAPPAFSSPSRRPAPAIRS